MTGFRDPRQAARKLKLARLRVRRGALNRVKAFEYWLTHARSEQRDIVLVDYLVPDPATDEDDVITRLGHELRRNYIGPAEIADILEQFDAGMLARHLREHKLPAPTSVRHGEFGDALSGAIFRRTRRYCVLVLKLRYKQPAPTSIPRSSGAIASRASCSR